MLGSYFSPVEQGVIAGSAAATLLACLAHLKNRDHWALGLVLLSAFCMRAMVAQLDPFLNNWDESIHAVVAKNMIEHPFTPMLYTDPALGLDIVPWDRTHIWLHKQPFFLWMMALGIKVFGNSVWAARMASALFTTALVFFTYGIGRAMHGRRVAFIAAVLMAWSYWILMLVLGSAMLDHNDAIFITLVGGSFWGWMHWRGSMTWWKAVVIGLFMGCAALTKWLPGFLLMGGWAVMAATSKAERKEEFRWMTIAFLTGIAVLIPWQISAWVRFPDVMAYEMELNSLHLWTAVEDHGGGWDFYFRSIQEQFHGFPGWMMFGALLLGIAASIRRDVRLMALVSVVLTYGFYTVAATKMSAFPMLIIPFFFVGMAVVIQALAKLLPSARTRAGAMIVLTIATSAALLDLERIQKWHTEQARRDGFIWWLRGDNLHNLEVIDRLEAFVGPDHGTGVVVYNVPFPATMDMMYLHGHQVLTLLPEPDRAEKLIRLGRKVIIVDPPGELEAAMPDGVLYFRTEGNGFKQPPI